MVYWYNFRLYLLRFKNNVNVPIICQRCSQKMTKFFNKATEEIHVVISLSHIIITRAVILTARSFFARASSSIFSHSCESK